MTKKKCVKPHKKAIAEEMNNCFEKLSTISLKFNKLDNNLKLFRFI